MDQASDIYEAKQPLSFADAAAQVLQDSGTPLHYREICKRALEQNLIQTSGRTPEYTLSSIFSVDIKNNSHQSRFTRVRPGIFGLRSWRREEAEVSPLTSTESEKDRRVRVPRFPSYSELRLVLPIWNGRDKSQITGLQATIATLRGTPQAPVNWTNPDVWIAEQLQGDDREIANAIWQKTNGKVNPRHVYGHWLLACTYQLLIDNGAGQMMLSERGQNFVDYPDGEAVALVDEQEGVLTILTIVAEKGTGRRADFIDDWADYLARYSRYGTDSTIKDTLSRRLHSILERKLLSRTGSTYSITDNGLNYLRQTGGPEDADTSSGLQEILQLVTQQQQSVRASIFEILTTMEPVAFEHLIKQLLEAMNYQNVTVTAPSHDKGVDVVADIELGITSVREVVQAKRQQSNVQRAVLDALRGSLYRFQAVRGTIITTASFSKGAMQEAFAAGAPPITLINGDKLIDLLIEFGIGVRTRPVKVLELDADAFARTDEGEDS